jgi:diadenosine tetraphosphate (Ap4A) HIT family hydrolase
MASIFTRIIQGDIPGTFVWRDDVAVAFLSINPISRGHTLVVPIAEVEHWVDLPDDVASHLMTLSTRVGRAVQAAFRPVKVGLVIAGYEVPHTHLHVIPTWSMADLDFRNAASSIDRETLEETAEMIKRHL